MKFHATVARTGGTTTGIPVPAGLVASLGAGKRPPVVVTIKGYRYHSTIGVMNGESMIPVSAEVRREAGVSGGDRVEVLLDLDTAAREVPVPPELRRALERDPLAKRAFDSLSRSRQQRYTIPIEKAKAAETRLRNARKAVADLHAEGARPATYHLCMVSPSGHLRGPASPFDVSPTVTVP